MRGIVGVSLLVAVLGFGCRPASVGATVSGTLLLDGQPAPAGIAIEFTPKTSGGSPSNGITDGSGRYELRFSAYTLGAQPGEHVVTLQIPQASNADGTPAGIPPALSHIRLPASVSGPRASLTRTVKPGRNRIDIDVATDGAATRE